MASQNFKGFANEWASDLTEVTRILNYLGNYPQQLAKLGIKHLIKAEELLSHLEEWHWLYAKFNGEEAEFFKPYWIPLQRNTYHYFLDMSDKNYPIFGYDFILHYSKNVLFESIADFDRVRDNEAALKVLKEIESENTMAHIKRDHKQKNALAYTGKAPVEKPTIEEISREDGVLKINRSRDGKKITVKHTTSSIIGLLPFEMSVQVVNFHMEVFYAMGEGLTELKYAKNVRNFTYFVRSKGRLREKKYKVVIGDNIAMATFNKNTFKISSISAELLNDFCFRLFEMCNEEALP